MSRFIPIYEEIFLRSAVFPDLAAVICRDECISFSRLDQFSSNLAWQLQESGIGPGCVVGINLFPSANLAISIFAVLKSGAAYIPLSSNFPEERIRYILKDADARLVITDNSLSHILVFGQTPVLIPDWSEVKDHNNKRVLIANPVKASDLAYILYTSGSTGKPKGVMIEHRNLNYYVHWFCQCVMPESRVGLPLTSSFIFAAAITQFFSTLLSGKTLHILDPLVIRQPDKLLQWYSMYPGMGLYCVPTLWSEILNYLDTADGVNLRSSAPSCVYLSGEAVTDDLLKRSFSALPSLQLWNLYGPTEATANLTAARLYPGDPAHIGKPLHGTTVFIVGDDMNLVDQGVAGELIASGEGIARGYLNLPEITGTTFFSSKLNGADTIRMYRSGDLVKQDEAGRLIYIGRKDQQVKIRGFRIELSEIEQALLAIEEVKQAVVKVVDERQNGKRLVAYLVFKAGNSVPVVRLRKILMRILPDYMVPEVFVALDHLPQLPNGKIDRKSLPLPGIQRPDLGYPAVPPSTTDEKMIVRIWEEVLGLEGIGLDDNFFDLGGNSLKAGAIVLDVKARTGIGMPIRHIFDYPTPGKLSRLQVKVLQQNTPPEVVSTDIVQSGLSENQKALWFLQQMEPGLSAYNIFYSITLTGQLDIAGFEKALRTIMPGNGNQPDLANPGSDNNVLEVFLSQTGAQAVSMDTALEHARSMADSPFNLEQGKPFRFILYRLDDDRHLLAFIVHHSVFDGFSFGIFLKQLSLFYDQAHKGDDSGHQAPAASYSQFCNEEKHYLNSIEYETDKSYWQKQLLNAPTFFEIPTDFTRPEFPTHEGGQVRRMIHPLLKSRLKSLSDDMGASLFMTCLAAFSILLFRHTGRKDILIGTPVANRLKKSFLSLIGYFVNTMLVRTNIDSDLAFRDWMGLMRNQILEGLDHSRFPFTRTGEVLKTERIPGINPFFQIMFAYHETDWEFSTHTGISGLAREEFFGRSKFDIFTEIFDSGDTAEIVLTFSSRLYHPGTIEILLDHFIQILEEISVSPETSIHAINLISPEEHNKIVYQWNETAFEHQFNGNVADMVVRQAEITPDLPALVSRQEVITYSEMARVTEVIAGNLRHLGVKNGVAVGIHLENSPNMVMCIIAVFRAGGIYIPLDPYYPDERLRYVIEKTRVRFLIVDEEQISRKRELSEQIIPVRELLKESSELQGPASSEPDIPGNLAYIMFTSGSTGNPKGVMIRHDSLLNFMVWMKTELKISSADTFLSTTSINFDISFLELFTPLISGASLVLEKRSELQAPEKIEVILNEMKVNTVQFVPSGLKALCDAGVLRRARYLKNIISGGEKLSRSLQEQIFSESDGILINLYGPTEATVYMACWHCRRNSPLRMVPIGFPIFNASFYILDEKLEPVPVGVTGEIYLGGQVLAEGYFEDTAQTASRFLTDPFLRGKGNRIYKTGDLGRYLYDGSVEFLGRTDHQVKVRGFRIELGEVESNILRFPGVRRVVVYAREHGEEDIRLTAYIVQEPSASLNEKELREFLRLHLPAYMIPGHFIIAPAIPTLPNGKTDFKALINLRPPVPKVPEFIHLQMNETEASLIELWKEILDHGAFTPHDNFFEVGGHSLLLVRLKDLIAEKLKEEVSIVDLFHYPTIRSLATFLRKDKPVHPYIDVAKRVAMRNKNIRQQNSKRISPDNNQS